MKFKIENYDKVDIATILIEICILIFQLINLIYENLFRLEYHLGYDASGHFLKAYEMQKQGTLLVDHWSDTSSLFWDTSGPLAAIFIKITGRVFASYGLANLIISTFVLIAFVAVLDKFGVDIKFKLLGMIVILCPFLGVNFSNYNDLQYFSMMWVNSAPYNVKMLMTLGYLWIILSIREKTKANGVSRRELVWMIVVGAALAILYVISAISSGYFMLVTVLGPVFVWVVIEMLIDNDIKRLIKQDMIINCAFIVLSLSGKIFATKVLNYSGFADGMVLTGLVDFWSNLGGMLTGYMQLMYSMPMMTYVSALSKDGVIFLCNFAVSIGILFAIVLAIKKAIVETKDKDFCDKAVAGKRMLITLIGYHILMYTVVYTTYQAKFFEGRYLIQALLASIILVIVYLDNINNGLVIKKLILVGVLATTLIISAGSHYYYNTIEEDVYEMELIKRTVSAYESPIVYLYDHGDLMMNMRPYDTSKVYKLFLFDDEGYTFTGHSADYTYYDNKGDYEGPIVMVTTPDRFEEMPEEMQEEFTLRDTLYSVCVWTCDRNCVAERYR